MIKLKSDIKKTLGILSILGIITSSLQNWQLVAFFYFALKQPSLENINPCVRYALHYSYKAQKYFLFQGIFHKGQYFTKFILFLAIDSTIRKSNGPTLQHHNR